MNKIKNNSSGVITVFLTLLLIPLLAFGTLIMEAGRYVSAKEVLAEAQVTASMSILANYNVYLHERFGLLAVDPEAAGEVGYDVTFANTLKYNTDSDNDISSSSKLVKIGNDISFSVIYKLSDFNVLERQVLEYAKYSVPYVIISQGLNLEDMIDKLLGKLNISNVFGLLEDMETKTSSAVDALDAAFKALGEFEYQAMGLSNFIGHESDKTVDDYKDENIYNDYVDESFAWGLLGDDKKPPTYSDSEDYKNAYNAFVSAVNEKVNYMKQNPDPQPKVDAAQKKYNDLSSALNGTEYTTTKNSKSTYENRIALLAFLRDNTSETEIKSSTKQDAEYYSVNSYTYSISQSNGTYSVYQSGSSAYYKYINNGNKVGILSAVNALKSSSEPTYTEITYDELKEFMKDEVSSYNGSNEATVIESYTSKLSAYQNAVNRKSAAYTLLEAMNAEKTAYENAISGYNETITSTKSTYTSRVSTAKSKFGSVASAASTAIEKLKTAKTAFETTDSYNEQDAGAENQKTSGATTILAKMAEVEEYLSTAKSTAESASSELSTIASNLNNISAGDIKAGSGISVNDSGLAYSNINSISTKVGFKTESLNGYIKDDFTKIGEFCDAKAVDMSGEDFNVQEDSGNLSEDSFSLKQLWDSVTKVFTIINPAPSTYDKSLDMSIDGTSKSLLPNFTETSPVIEEDQAYVDSLKAAVNQRFGDAYANQLTGMYEANGDHNSFASSMENLQKNIKKLKEKADAMKDYNFLEMVKAVGEIIELIGEVIGNVASLFTQMKELLMYIAEKSYNALLINTYITQKFPSRINVVKDAKVYPAGETTGKAGASYFSGACIEYVIAGKTDADGEKSAEQQNQAFVFWIIFGIRALVNCIQIATQTETMELISACNIFAPLMFIAAVYLETNIDLNYLVCLNEKVPLWKEDAHLSVEGLMKIGGDLLDYVSDTRVQITASGKGKRYHVAYGEGCYTLARSEVVETLSMSEAVKEGYTPCKVCNPPTQSPKDGEDNDTSDGFVYLSYDNYLWILLFLVGGQKKLERTANLIQLETRYSESLESNGVANFRLEDAGTYVRSAVTASYDSMLPMISLGKNTNSFMDVYNLEYVGY